MATRAKSGGAKKKPRKQKAPKAAQAAAEDNNVKPSETMLLPPAKKVQDLARRCKSWKKQGAEITGQIGQAIAEAAEKIHLDKKAFSIARQLDAMSEKKLATTYYQLLHFIDVLGIEKRATAQGELGLGESEGEDEDEDEEDEEGEAKADRPAAGNVHHIGGAARQVAERAGEG